MQRRTFGLFLVAILMLVAPCALYAQAKIYTKKAKLDDFPLKIMKVVVDGESPLALDLKNEVSSRWRLSPFEFCTSSDLAKLKEDNSLYFLRLVTDDGIAFLLLEKGGREDDANRLKRPFEVVRIPVGSAGTSFSFGIPNLDVFLDIIQMFVQDARVSDKYGYLGLEAYNTAKIAGRRIALGANPDNLFAEAAADVLVPVIFKPEPEGSWCYKMLVDSGSHELFYFSKARYKGESDAGFTPMELKSFELRHAVLPE